MKKGFFILILLFLFLGILIFAQEEAPPGVTFPIAELGNCASRAECEVYCDLPENMRSCLNFAEAHNLISSEEARIARKMLELGETAGPGGCRGKIECETYCNDISHIEECITFAEKYGLIPPAELEEGKKVAQAIKRGVKPPNCKNKRECDLYCSQPENTEECLTFAEAAGLIPPEELADAKKALEAIRKGVKPPPCRGKTECDLYCSAPENLEGCLTFAEAAGFISPDEAAMVRKTGGRGPGGCRGKEACEKYCEDQANAEECINFAVEHGFMPKEEAEMAKKMLAAGLRGGPGGCKGKAECEAYCNDLNHMEECINFALQAGFMSPEEAAQAKKMAEMGVTTGPGGCRGKEECDIFCQKPENMEECLEFGLRIGQMTPEEAEKARKGMEMMQRGGPGDCKSEPECKAYCDDPVHAQECIQFGIEQGFISPEEGQRMLEMMKMGPPPTMPPPEGVSPPTMPPAEALPTMPPPGEMPISGPGGCKTEAECQVYCSDPAHFQECQQFGAPPPPTQMMPPPTEMMPPDEQLMPPPTEAPQSLLDRLRQFLASLLSAFGF